MKIMFDFNLNNTPLKHTAHSLIKGVITKKGAPLSCQVHCYDRKTGKLLSKSVSSQNGSYVLFSSVSSPSYIVAIDPTEEFNLATEDNIK